MDLCSSFNLKKKKLPNLFNTTWFNGPSLSIDICSISSVAKIHVCSDFILDVYTYPPHTHIYIYMYCWFQFKLRKYSHQQLVPFIHRNFVLWMLGRLHYQLFTILTFLRMGDLETKPKTILKEYYGKCDVYPFSQVWYHIFS